MHNKYKTQLTTKNPMFGLYLYPEAKVFMEKQQDIMWTSQEIPIEKDINDYKQNMTKDQFQLVSLTLQIFVEIEQKVGNIWEQIATWFPHAEVEGACTQISAMEKSVHAFFYQKMNDVLAIEPEEIAKNQETVAVLRNKLTLLDSITKSLNKDYLLSLFTVSAIEQVLLFSNFAMLKSFKANGHNLIQNTLVGVDFVISDETIHGLYAGYLYKTYLSELKEVMPPEEFEKYVHKLRVKQQAVLTEILQHEDAIITYLFESKEWINDISAEQLKSFIRSRANDVLDSLDIDLTQYTITDTSINEWFYKGAASIKMHDFFVAGTNQYRRNWKTENLSILPHIGATNE